MRRQLQCTLLATWARTTTAAGRPVSLTRFSRVSPKMQSGRAASAVSSTTASRLAPRIAQPELWKAVIPKISRRTLDQAGPGGPARKPARHDATMLLILGMLAGSQAIQLLQTKSTRQERDAVFDRRISQLAELLERVQRGDGPVDLRAALGTGMPQAESEWNAVARQLADDSAWIGASDKKAASKRPGRTESANSADSQHALAEVSGSKAAAKGFF